MDPQIPLLNELVSIAEELLFGFRLKEYQVCGYEEQRARIYAQLEIRPKNNIKKLIRNSQSKGLQDSKEAGTQINMYSELEKIIQLQKNETESWIEGIRWETVQRIQKSEQICKEYRGFLMTLFGFLDGISAGIAELAGVRVENKELLEFDKDLTPRDIVGDYEEVLAQAKARQIREILNLNECKKYFRDKENSFFEYFEAIRSMVKAKELQNVRFEGLLQEQKVKFEEESCQKSEKIKRFEEALVKSKENDESKHQKAILKIIKESSKKEELLLRQKTEEIQEIIDAKEKIISKLHKAFEDYEKTNEKQSIFINQLRSESQELQNDRQCLLKQTEKNSILIENLKSSLEESENNLKYSQEQVSIVKEQNKEMKKRIDYMEEEFENNVKMIENKYSRVLERVRNDEKEGFSDLERNISALEEEIVRKNSEIEGLYRNFEEVHAEKIEIQEVARLKETECQRLLSNLKLLEAEHKNIQEDLQRTWKKVDEFQIKAEKCYLSIKKKSKNGANDYFSELLKVVVELSNDKEWLIRKLEEISRKPERNEHYPKVYNEISRTEYDSEFVNTSLKSFQALKSFEKTRSEVFHNIKNKNY